MANDKFGVWKKYPDSTSNPFSRFAEAFDSSVADGFTGNKDTGISAVIDNGLSGRGMITIEGKGGYNSSSINLNHKSAGNNGYLSNKSDWRNTEITFYVNVTSPHVDSIDCYVRGGSLAGAKCEVTGYVGTLSYSGAVRFSKQQNAGSRYNTSAQLPISNIKERWVGFKYCCYDDGKNNSPVHLEIYLDDGESNNWKQVATYTDAEGWGSNGGACGSDFPDKKLSWTGPLVSIAYFNVTQIQFKKLSVREIDAGGTFNDGGSDPTGGAGNGGSGSTGSGSGGQGNGSGTVNHNNCTQVNNVSNTSSSGKGGSNKGGNKNDGGDSGNPSNNNNSNEEEDDEGEPVDKGTAPSTSTGSTDTYGVKMLYATGPKRNDPKPNVRDDGTRFDFTGLGSAYASIEMSGYFRIGSEYDDEVAAKTGGGNHSDGTRPRCYIIGWGTEDGEIRLRYEDKHPDTNTLQDGPGQGQGGGIGLVDRWVGYKSIKRNQSDGVLLEGWQDQGSNDGNTPANAWKLIGKWVDTKLNWRTPPSDHQETWRIDNEGGADDLDSKWMSIAEIRDGDSTTPGTGGGSSPGTQTGSDGTTDSHNCSCGAGTGSSSTPSGSSNNSGSNQSCSGNNSGNNDPNGESGNADTVVTEPPPIVTFSKDFIFMHNIMTEVENSCTIGFPREEKDPESIYNVEADILTYQDLGYATANQEVGLYVATKESILFNKPIRKVTINALKRTVAADLSTCSGTMQLEIISVLDGKTKVVFKELATGLTDFNVASIDVNDQALTWVPVILNDGVEYQCKVGDMLVLKYFDNSAAIDKCIRVKHTKTDKIDGYNTHLVVKLITGYSFILKDFDAAFNVFI